MSLTKHSFKCPKLNYVPFVFKREFRDASRREDLTAYIKHFNIERICRLYLVDCPELGVEGVDWREVLVDPGLVTSDISATGGKVEE